MKKSESDTGARNLARPIISTEFTQLPAVGFVRLRGILSVIPVGRSTWWEGVRTGKFPRPVKLSPRVTAWRVEDIRRLIERLGQDAKITQEQSQGGRGHSERLPGRAE